MLLCCENKYDEVIRTHTLISFALISALHKFKPVANVYVIIFVNFAYIYIYYIYKCSQDFFLKEKKKRNL